MALCHADAASNSLRRPSSLASCHPRPCPVSVPPVSTAAPHTPRILHTLFLSLGLCLCPHSCLHPCLPYRCLLPRLPACMPACPPSCPPDRPPARLPVSLPNCLAPYFSAFLEFCLFALPPPVFPQRCRLTFASLCPPPVLLICTAALPCLPSAWPPRPASPPSPHHFESLSPSFTSLPPLCLAEHYNYSCTLRPCSLPCP